MIHTMVPKQIFLNGNVISMNSQAPEATAFGVLIISSASPVRMMPPLVMGVKPAKCAAPTASLKPKIT